MRKDDRALKEVWNWKEEIYKETKDMPLKEFIKFAHKRAQVFCKKYNIQLTKASSVSLPKV